MLMFSFPGSFLTICEIMGKVCVEVTLAAVCWHFLCAKSSTGLISRPSHMAPRPMHLHFGSGGKGPQQAQ